MVGNISLQVIIMPLEVCLQWFVNILVKKQWFYCCGGFTLAGRKTPVQSLVQSYAVRWGGIGRVKVRKMVICDNGSSVVEGER